MQHPRWRDPRRTENIDLGLIARGERQRQDPASKNAKQNFLPLKVIKGGVSKCQTAPETQ